MEEIKSKANYCLNCVTKPCSNKGCPLNNNIPGFIKAIKEENYKQAYEILSETTVLESVCGRICPHTKQCQGSCVRGIKGQPVSIGELEAFVGDIAIKEEYKLFYNYDLIDHINFRIKESDSIIKKMKNKECKLTYKEMIENINDIAGIRIVCSLKKDIFSIKNLLQKLPGVRTIKEKDYVTNPKKSGYSAYHIILGIPVVLSQQIIYVKVEVQIRTMAMDFWSSLEHKMKYKPEDVIDKKTSKEWVNCAKIINKLDNKMMLMS